MKTAILGAKLIQGTGGLAQPDSAVLIDGDRIGEVGLSGVTVIPPDAQVINAQGKFLLPGMIDLHTHSYHPMFLPGAGFDVYRKEQPAYASLIAANSLRQALQAGITTVREVIAMDYVDIALRRAINDGVVLGPRCFVAGTGIVMTGGGVPTLEGFWRYADGEVGVRLAVREQIKMGVDLIKVLPHSKLRSGYSPGELAAVVDEAHCFGMRVACHAFTSDETRTAAVAGVDTIEHGAAMDDETLDMMAEKGIFWVPTCHVLQVQHEKLKEAAAKPDVSREEKALCEWAIPLYDTIMPEMQRAFEGAVRRGVKIGTGTDMIHRDRPFACLPEEVEQLTKWGYTPMQALEAATSIGADALGKLADLGSVEKGKYADLIMVDEDPLKDITALKHVTWVMKAGRVVPFSPEYDRLAGKAPWA